MHTEEDTFNALRRIPFMQMRHLLILDGGYPLTEKQLLEENGWTLEEYKVAWNNWWNNNNAQI